MHAKKEGRDVHQCVKRFSGVILVIGRRKWRGNHFCPKVLQAKIVEGREKRREEL